MNIFRQTKDGSLDRKYLRVCAVYRLLSRQRIGYSRAIELLARKHSPAEMAVLRGTVELWRSGPFRNRAIAA